VTRGDTGGRVHTYGATNRTRLSPSTVRALSLVALVVASMLGTVYAVGQHLGARGAPVPRPVAASLDSSSRPDGPAGQAAAASPSPAGRGQDDVSASPSGPPRGAANLAQLPPERTGPYGSRQTTGSPQVALTFDDGPDPRYTPQVLAMLRAYHVKATFCLIGGNVAQHPELVRQIVAEGHTLCNHTWSHDVALGSRSTQLIRADLMRTSQAIEAAAPGAPIAYFRQPGGNWTTNVVAVARELGMTSLHWAVDPQDWRLPGAAAIVERVTSATKSGSIVLMHDSGGDRQGTMAALRAILPDLTRRFSLEALPTGAAG
jgi:peptidoglycan/xylan/chitin deacetylase (PgdA/CDA1 family)